MNKTLQVLDRTLNTVFQKQSGNFLSAPLDAGKVREIDTKMDEYKAEMEAMIEIMHEFYVIVKRTHGDRSAAFERYRSLQQCVGILNYNMEHAIRGMMEQKRIFPSGRGRPQEEPSLVIQNTSKSKVLFQFNILREQPVQAKHMLLIGSELECLPLSDRRTFAKHMDKVNALIGVLEAQFLSVCHQDEGVSLDDWGEWYGAEDYSSDDNAERR